MKSTRWNHRANAGVVPRMTRLCLALVVACTPSEPATRISPDAPAASPIAVPSPVELAKPSASPPAIDPAAAVPTHLYAEHLADLRLGMTVAELQAARPSLVQDGDIVTIPPEGGPNDVIAAYGKRLVDTAADLSVELESPTKDGEFRAAVIWAEIDAKAVTKRGIGIGATRAAVKKAYPRARPLVEDELYARESDEEEVWFGFERGKVMRIRLGPATDPDDIEE